jgi:hypothetical protein
MQDENEIARLMVAEFRRAVKKHPEPIRSAHEAFGVIYEEFNIEFGAEMHSGNRENQFKELIQVGAMVIRSIHDLKLGK